MSAQFPCVIVGHEFACTLGLAVFVDVRGNVDEHAHWCHQIAISMDDTLLNCHCDGKVFQSKAVFVPAGHLHSVNTGSQINLFFDPQIDWLDDVFGGAIDTHCAQVLDRDTLEGIQTCFYKNSDLKLGLEAFAYAYEDRQADLHDQTLNQRWVRLLKEVEQLSNTLTPEQGLYAQLGRLLAADAV
ncbi:MAG TPA: hypothetical protein VGE55_12405 [Limnobacter sp.]|uniref:hypothetical protein n=1 Tax=Limnobacter sp. TaxID=2003368 RepID=UPI002ED9DFA9